MSSKVDFDRKDLKTPDAFLENVGRASRYFEENRTLVIGAAIAVIALFLGGVTLHSYVEHSADAAAATFIRGAEALDQNNSATAKAALDNLADRSGIYGELGRLYEADLAAREERWDDALPKYEEVARSGSTPYIRQIALIGKGFVLENTSKLADAADAYAAAGSLAGPYQEQALRDQLRTARAAGKDDLAKAAINKILELYPETPDADQLSAQLASAPKPQ